MLIAGLAGADVVVILSRPIFVVLPIVSKVSCSLFDLSEVRSPRSKSGGGVRPAVAE